MALGVLTGIVGALLDDGTDRSRMFPSGAAMACGLCLLLFMWTDFGNGLGRSVAAIDPTALRVVPLTGDTVDSDAIDAGWVDASKAAIQQNGIGIQVVSVTLSSASGKSPQGGATPPQSLTVRLRIQRVWGGEKTLLEESHKADQPQAEHPRPILSDDTGRAYPVRPGESAPAGSRGDSVFIFDAPAASYKFLRLELTATPWGGASPFRFKIPNVMVRSEPVPGVRPGLPKGPRGPAGR
jgi:hypothetical protein